MGLVAQLSKRCDSIFERLYYLLEDQGPKQAISGTFEATPSANGKIKVVLYGFYY